MNLDRVGLDIAADTAYLKDQIDLTLTDTFSITSLSLAADSSDGLAETYSSRAANIPGAINHDEEGEAESFDDKQDRPVSSTRFVIHLQAGTEIDITDRVTHDQTGVVYEVRTIENRVSEEVATTVRVVKVDGGAV